MTTAALAKIKCAEELSWLSLAQVCRLCLRKNCIKFDIFDDEEEETDSNSAEDSLYERIRRFYDIKVARTEKLPTKICHDCLFQMEVHTEFRHCVLQNEQRLREFAGDLFPKDEDEDETHVTRNGVGLPEFTEQELQAALIVDPNQVYVSSSDEEEDMNNAEDDDEVEEGEVTGAYLPENDDTILLSDDDEDDEDEESQGAGGPENLNHSVPFAASSTSILEQHLMQGLLKQAEQKTFFLCQFCDLCFKFQDSCREHEMTKHDRSRPYNCVACSFNSDNRTMVQQHMRDIHGTQKPFLCADCKKGFTRRSDLRKHTIVHTGVRPYTCQVCQKSFSRNTNLTKHMRIHAGLKPFVCAKCPKTFVTGSDLVRHQRIHDGVKPFQCSVCPSSFARRDKLINHQNMHIRRGHLGGGGSDLLNGAALVPLGPASVSSNAMNYSSSSNNNANQQATTAGNTAAGESPGMVIDLDPLTEMRSANGMDMSQRILEAALMRGSLALTTPNHFGTLMNLPEQLFATSAVDPPPPPIESRIGLPSSLVGHQHSHHLHQQHHQSVTAREGIARPFVCPECGKSFPRKGELERHETVHTGAKPFACTMCEKRFSRKDKLVRHKRTHLETGNEQRQEQNQFLSLMGTEVPQISFTAALENYRRKDVFANHSSSSSGGRSAGRNGPAASVAAAPKATDFIFRPNFYSQIKIGEDTEGGAQGPEGVVTGERMDIKEEF